MAIQTFTAPFDASNVTNFYAYAHGLSNAIVAAGWTRLTTAADPGIVQWGNILADLSFAANNIPATAPRPTLNSLAIAAWNSGVAYLGLSAANTSGTANIVTSGGISWICLVSNTNNTPGANADWLPYIYDIFESNDGGTPIYMKIVYMMGTGTPGAPYMYFAFGTGITGTGLVAGNTSALAAGTTPDIQVGTQTSTGQGGVNQVECDVVSNPSGGDLAIMMFRPLDGTSNVNSLVIVERSKNQAGASVNLFFSFLLGNASGSTGSYQSILFPSYGGVVPSVQAVHAPFVYGSASPDTIMGSVPARPCFPLVGYVANPMLSVLSTLATDVASLSVVNVIMYGATHTYAVLKQSAIAVLDATNSTNSCALLVRYE